MYKMTYADGFAPNPFGGILSLATCKPGIRKVAKAGEYILGFGTKSLEENARQKLDIDNNLVYMMKVNRIIPWEDYYNYCKANCPEKLNIENCGDCIYRPDGNTPALKYVKNPFHGLNDMGHDLSGENVLLGDGYFLGTQAIDISDILESDWQRLKRLTCTNYGMFYKGKNPEKFIRTVISRVSGKVACVSELKDTPDKIKLIFSSSLTCSSTFLHKCC